MVTTTTDPKIEAVERELAGLREQRAATLVALELVEAELAAAETPLEAARRVFDAALATWGQARAAHGAPGQAPAEDYERTRSAEQLAEAAWLRARDEVQPLLVAVNEIRRRRSDLTMRERMLEMRIGQAETALERARPATQQRTDLLAGLRGRLGLGPVA
jgi:chromosome segregation ATPase